MAVKYDCVAGPDYCLRGAHEKHWLIRQGQTGFPCMQDIVEADADQLARFHRCQELDVFKRYRVQRWHDVAERSSGKDTDLVILEQAPLLGALMGEAYDLHSYFLYWSVF